MEKKEIKISLSTFFLIFAIIIIIAMACFIYKLYKEKEQVNIKANELDTRVETLENTIDNIKTKTENENITENTSTAISKNNNEEKILTEDEATKILKEKFANVENIWLNPTKIFNVKAQDSEGRSEIIDYKKTILKYGTENLFNEIEKNRPSGIMNENNVYYSIGAGGARAYDGLDGFENIKITESTITATLKTKQTTYDENKDKWVKTTDKKSEFKLIKQGNEWFVDEFNSSDLD